VDTTAVLLGLSIGIAAEVFAVGTTYAAGGLTAVRASAPRLIVLGLALAAVAAAAPALLTALGTRLAVAVLLLVTLGAVALLVRETSRNGRSLRQATQTAAAAPSARALVIGTVAGSVILVGVVLFLITTR
jgi:hypothetical protein